MNKTARRPGGLFMTMCCSECDHAQGFKFDSFTETYTDIIRGFEKSGWSFAFGLNSETEIIHVTCPGHAGEKGGD